MPDLKTEPRMFRRTTTDEPQAIQTMHDVFSDWERRAILHCLKTHSGEAPIETVACHLVGWRRGEPEPAPPDDEEIERVRDRVVFSHVLKMDEFGILSYDPGEETVELPDDMEVSVSPPWNQTVTDQ